MKIIKYVDIIATEYTEEGEPYDIVYAKNIGIPEHINDAGVSAISPYFTKKGRLFKNVSLMTYEGQQIKVAGNYNELNNILQNKTKPILGYYGKRK